MIVDILKSRTKMCIHGMMELILLIQNNNNSHNNVWFKTIIR